MPHGSPHGAFSAKKVRQDMAKSKFDKARNRSRDRFAEMDREIAKMNKSGELKVTSSKDKAPAKSPAKAKAPPKAAPPKQQKAAPPKQQKAAPPTPPKSAPNQGVRVRRLMHSQRWKE